jgi:YVTN family beta-propeller protein
MSPSGRTATNLIVRLCSKSVSTSLRVGDGGRKVAGRPTRHPPPRPACPARRTQPVTRPSPGGSPYGLAQSPNGQFLLASNDGQSTQSLQVIDTAGGSVTQSIPYTGDEALSFGIAFAPDGGKVYVSAGGNNKIRVYAIAGETLTEQAPIVLPPGPVRFFFGDQAPFPDGLAISADGTRLYVANNLGDSMSIVNAITGLTLATTPVGHNPYTVVLSADGKTA